MPRFLRYEDALPWVRGQARLTAEGMARGLDATRAAAASFLRRLEAEGVVGPAEPDGTHPVLGERRRRWAEAAPISADRSANRPADRSTDPWAEVARWRSAAEAAARRA